MIVVKVCVTSSEGDDQVTLERRVDSDQERLQDHVTCDDLKQNFKAS